MGHVAQSGAPLNLSASGIVAKASGDMLGFYVNSTSSGTLVLRNGTLSNSPAVGGTITPAVGFQCYPGAFPNGCYATIGGTLDVTFFFAAG